MRSVIDIVDLSVAEVDQLLATACDISEHPDKYSEKCKEEGFEPMSYEEFKADFDHNFKKNYEKINDTEKIANDCFNLNDKIVINQIFLKEFGTYYPQLQIRIKTLEQKNVANNLRNNNSTTNTSNNEYTKDQIPASFKTPTFGLK